MNNIEIKNIPGLESGMTDKQINKLKSKKEVVTEEVVEVVVETEQLPSTNKSHNYEYVKLDLYADPVDERDYKLSETIDVSLELPSSIDWTSKMSSVKDQGSLGSCVGFATAAMKEFQEQVEHDKEVAAGKKYKRTQDEYDLSEQWIYYKCKEIDPWPDEEGTSIRCAMQVLNKLGVPCEKAYPYNDAYKGEPEKWAKLVSKWGLIDSYWRCNNLSELKTALVDGPVVIGIACFLEIFYVGTDGVVSYPSNPSNVLGGHAICVVGYDDTNSRVKFKNSWGTGWGKKGYGFLSYDYINDFMWDAWVAKDLAVTKQILNDNVNNELE